jgi:hypothetical protein
MRNDMDKVIVERPRSGRANAKTAKRTGQRKLPGDLSQIGLGKLHAVTAGQKGLNENLSPLRRYLEAQTGRPWNKVWAEISENLKPSSTVQQHVRDHIPDFVAIKTALREGQVWAAARYGKPVLLKDAWQRLYVDPRSGLLRKNPHYRKFAAIGKEAARKAQAERDARMREAGRWLQYHLLSDGAWWEVTLASSPPAKHPQPRDAVLGAGLSDLKQAKLYGREGVYAIGKRQLSGKEAKALKLRA